MRRIGSDAPSRGSIPCLRPGAPPGRVQRARSARRPTQWPPARGGRDGSSMRALATSPRILAFAIVAGPIERMIFGVGPEWIIVLVVILVLFGGSQLPKL